MRIILDPGHGGQDSGAVGNGLREKDLVLALAKEVISLLGDYQVEVISTREGDVAVSLAARAKLANDLQADFFCSLHVNAGGGSGFESYIHPEATPETRSLAGALHARVADFYIQKGFPDRGLKRANFLVLRETAMPAVLLENLFIDNPRDAACLADATFLRELAGVIVSGLVQTLGLKKNTGWDPAGEIARLRERGLIVDEHAPDAFVTWGEFAAVMNRLLDRWEQNNQKAGDKG
ncbi:N-acetylmuramoyl-L-alanine amidase [Desulfofundulus thermobenzoicus]|uniref:N-acetylmuramoyl-L-alanine amidase n=1 Tax=Desulfofundulus thermobenzoicus TaxID=29376 RepID=A0A6N7IRZ4_9FIRM|nr:N-acetylmuramoyl-L-alanine amidase [Desulfofundulus thermobenzoicus]MQL52333.1 N-acetylmuramoyl-L-alanine amidase [Desulfofundulus thermobenzoicus]HHW43275.1 N-acetylmuramoyl-L-alanine amidase [Desulfotomaculum sp.]